MTEDKVTLAEYFGLDMDALRDCLEWRKQCQEEDEIYQKELAEKSSADNT